MSTSGPSWQSRLYRALTFVNSAGLRSVDPATSQRDLARDVAVQLEQDNARLEVGNGQLLRENERLRRLNAVMTGRFSEIERLGRELADLACVDGQS